VQSGFLPGSDREEQVHPSQGAARSKIFDGPIRCDIDPAIERVKCPVSPAALQGLLALALSHCIVADAPLLSPVKAGRGHRFTTYDLRSGPHISLRPIRYVLAHTAAAVVATVVSIALQ
jgi:hypothetical protein